jgi:23S rRNA (adenine2503-C2)-methyltransferase
MQIAEKTNLMNLDRAALEAFFLTLGEKPYRATQVLQWIHQFGAEQFKDMTNLSMGLRSRLDEIAMLEAPNVVSDTTAPDGTRKWLLRLRDGNCVETVFIPEENRGTLCVSSQVGCILNCTFCATGHQGFNRSMDTGEIVSQIWLANRILPRESRDERTISNVVFMGMGEPLLNFDNVVGAIRLMLDDYGYGLSRRRITVSTAGVVPMIDALHATSPVSLAVSLHAPNDELRDELVPLNRKYPIAELLCACRRYVADEPRRKVTFEYVMLEGVNDAPHHARQLAALLEDQPAKVNLIPFNPFPGTRYKRSGPGAIEEFRDILQKRGLLTLTRKTRGEDIDAACGQLAGRIHDRTRRKTRLAAGSLESP